MADRYEMPINGVREQELGERMQAAMTLVQGQFPPKTGIAVFAFDYGEGGGFGWIANGRRSDLIAALEEWIRHERKQS